MASANTCVPPLTWALLGCCIIVIAAVTTAATNAEQGSNVSDVYAVAGGRAELPCVPPSGASGATQTLVFWYKDGVKTPIYSVDFRSGSRGSQYHSSGTLRGRVSLLSGDSAGGSRQHLSKSLVDGARHLVVEDVRPQDQGRYRCRLDFQTRPTYSAVVTLHVV
ncbi:unnamed protein product, partial [Meganyctiphanes norvegica]